VRDGANVSFYHGPWCGGKALKEAFSDLFGIACDKDAAVATHLELSGGSNKWNARKAHDWDVDVFTLFFNLLYSVRVRREGKVKLWWTPSKKGLFVVSSFYNALDCNVGIHWKSIRRTKVPLRVGFFFPLISALGKIFISNNLRNKHDIVVDWCCMCKRDMESIDHLLLHCEVGCALWNAIFSSFGLS
jgi:hypothetical protein